MAYWKEAADTGGLGILAKGLLDRLDELSSIFAKIDVVGIWALNIIPEAGAAPITWPVIPDGTINFVLFEITPLLLELYGEDEVVVTTDDNDPCKVPP